MSSGAAELIRIGVWAFSLTRTHLRPARMGRTAKFPNKLLFPCFFCADGTAQGELFGLIWEPAKPGKRKGRIMNTRKMAELAVATMLLAAGAAQADITTWNLATDFSDTSNPAGAWAYGYKSSPGGSFTPYASFFRGEYGEPVWNAGHPDISVPNLFKNTWTGSILGVSPGQVSLHPGPGTTSVARWTAPAAGSYDVTVTFLPGNLGWMCVSVWKDGESLFQDQSEDVPLTYTQTRLDVAAGQTLDFQVSPDPTGYWGYGSTPVEATVTTPEPATLSLLVLGGLAVLKQKRKP